MSLSDLLNPLRHVSGKEYVGFWQMLFDSVFNGFWSRLIAVVSFILAWWFMVRRKQVFLGLGFILFTALVTYGHPLFRWLGLSR